MPTQSDRYSKNPVDDCFDFETRLWAHVLKRAAKDAKGRCDALDNSCAEVRDQTRREAAAWFRSRETDIGSCRWICDTLGLSWELIKERVRE